MESCQSAPAFPWATMASASSPPATISPEIARRPPSAFADTTPTRPSVWFSWFAKSGTDSGTVIPERSTTTGFDHPKSRILPPE